MGTSGSPKRPWNWATSGDDEEGKEMLEVS